MRFNFVEYMENCAIRLKSIGHKPETPKFFRISGIMQLDEVLGNLSKMSFPALLVDDNLEGMIADRSPSDNYLDTPYYVFHVVNHVPLGDFDRQEEVKRESKGIALKILAKMLRDKRRGLHGLTFLQFGNINYQAVGPLGDNCYGIMVSFTVPDTAPLVYDENDWEKESLSP